MPGLLGTSVDFSDPTVALRLGAERDQLGEQQRVDAQQEQLQGILGQQEQQAKLVADIYRRAGFANAAERFTQNQRQNQFALARRGLQGSSVDLSKRQQLADQLRTGVAGVETQAQQVQTQGLLQGQQLAGQLGQMSLPQNPFQAQGQQLQAQGLRRQAVNTDNLAGLQREQAGIQGAHQRNQGQILGNLLTGIGRGAEGYLVGSA